MSKMTKPQFAKLAQLELARENITQAIYDVVAPRMDVPFNDCYAQADGYRKQLYVSTINALETFRQEMINQGRAYRCASFGHFTPNWR